MKLWNMLFAENDFNSMLKIFNSRFANRELSTD